MALFSAKEANMVRRALIIPAVGAIIASLSLSLS
jgi:hypothetical protein